MKQSLSNTELVFFALLQSGLWEKDVKLLPYMPVDFEALYRLAEEQSVVGLIAAGLEHVVDLDVTKRDALPFLKKVIYLESLNAEMNSLIAWMIKRLEEEKVLTVLVKGQGIARCYERPMWRAAGDIDLLLDSDNYERAKILLSQIAQIVHSEQKTRMHIGMTILSTEIELHGTLHSGLSYKLDSLLDSTQNEMFREHQFREWVIDNTTIYLPSPDNDIIFIFSHILQHYYKGGIGLRQICDLCRLLWTFRTDVNRDLLEQRLRKMGVISEWQAFATLASEYLGMQKQAIPFFGEAKSRDARFLIDSVLETGNFGRNRDLSYQRKHLPVIIRKAITLAIQVKDTFKKFRIFPYNSIRFLFGFIRSRLED